MKTKSFGISASRNPVVSVRIDEPSILNAYTGKVTINWSAIGSVDIEDAEEFILALQRAINFADEELAILELEKRDRESGNK